MPRKSEKSSRGTAPSKTRHKREPAPKRATPLRRTARHDPDDIPEVTDEMVTRAVVVKGGGDIIVALKRRGRPPIGDAPRETVTMRIDRSVLSAYRATGPGWQSRINADLARSAKRLTKV